MKLVLVTNENFGNYDYDCDYDYVSRDDVYASRFTDVLVVCDMKFDFI